MTDVRATSWRPVFDVRFVPSSGICSLLTVFCAPSSSMTSNRRPVPAAQQIHEELLT